MSENKESFLPDVIEPLSNAVHQNIPETERQVDGALSTVVGFFNNVVLYPVKKANLTFRYKLEAFENDLKEKIKSVPEADLQVPPTMIAGPILEALRYAYDEEELRDMFENLLAAAMNRKKVAYTHPSFVDAIRQMSPLDAQLLRTIADRKEIVTKHVRFFNALGAGWFPSAMPYHFEESLLYLGEPFAISAAISNLIRLGLVRTYDSFLSNETKDCIKNNTYVLSRIEEYSHKEVVVKVDLAGTVITLDDYGKTFARICLA